MKINNLKKYRISALIGFAVGAFLFFFAMVNGQERLFHVTGMITYACLSFFLFTEAFVFLPPERSRFSIRLAKISFFLSLPGVLGIIVSLFGLVK